MHTIISTHDPVTKKPVYIVVYYQPNSRLDSYNEIKRYDSNELVSSWDAFDNAVELVERLNGSK